jgi:hypothetical protein
MRNEGNVSVFKSVADLQHAIGGCIQAHNKASTPFFWTPSVPAIFEKLAKILPPHRLLIILTT